MLWVPIRSTSLLMSTHNIRSVLVASDDWENRDPAILRIRSVLGPFLLNIGMRVPTTKASNLNMELIIFVISCTRASPPFRKCSAVAPYASDSLRLTNWKGHRSV